MAGFANLLSGGNLSADNRSVLLKLALASQQRNNNGTFLGALNSGLAGMLAGSQLSAINSEQEAQKNSLAEMLSGGDANKMQQLSQLPLNTLQTQAAALNSPAYQLQREQFEFDKQYKNRALEIEKAKSERAQAGALTPAEKAVDTEFGKEYVRFTTGGATDAQKNIDQLLGVRKELASGKNLTGAGFTVIPDQLQSIVAPEAKAVKERVEEVVQRNLREILGAQFTEKEGERLIARAYNQNLPEEENLRRLDALIKQIQGAYQAKADAAAYFEQNGTLRGWRGSLPKLSDFEDAVTGTQSTPLPQDLRALSDEELLGLL